MLGDGEEEQRNSEIGTSNYVTIVDRVDDRE